jgi:hypothetical protein
LGHFFHEKPFVHGSKSYFSGRKLAKLCQLNDRFKFTGLLICKNYFDENFSVGIYLVQHIAMNDLH